MLSKTLKRKLGQNTAEYLVMLVLIAGGSIGMFTYFGSTIKAHMSNIVAAFGGDTTFTKVDKIAGEGAIKGKDGVSMKGDDHMAPSVKPEAAGGTGGSN